MANKYLQKSLDYTLDVCTIRNMASHGEALAAILIDEPVATYCARLRDEGKSWRSVARQLAQDTDGQVDVTEQTLRNWVASAEAAA